MRNAIRADMDVVFPDPAPATITAGSRGALTAFNCCSESANPSMFSRSRSLSSFWEFIGIGLPLLNHFTAEDVC